MRLVLTLTDFYKNYRVKHVKNKKIGKILLWAVILSAIVLLIVSLVLRGSPHKKYQAKNFYFVYAGKYNSQAKATEISKQVSDLGGAGVIYTIGNTLFVVAGAYSNMEDAVIVKSQISTTFSEADVLKVSTKSFSKPVSKAVDNIQVCKNYYRDLNELCLELQNYSLAYDVGEIDISDVYKKLMTIKQNFTNLSNSLIKDDHYSKTMYASSLVVLEHFGSFFSSAFASNSPSKYLKKLHVSIIVEFVNMCGLI